MATKKGARKPQKTVDKTSDKTTDLYPDDPSVADVPGFRDIMARFASAFAEVERRWPEAGAFLAQQLKEWQGTSGLDKAPPLLRPEDVEVLAAQKRDAVIADIHGILRQNHGAVVDMAPSPIAYQTMLILRKQGWTLTVEATPENRYRVTVYHPMTLAPEELKLPNLRPSQEPVVSHAAFNEAGDRMDQSDTRS